MIWVEAVPAIVVAGALAIGPGLIVTAPLRLGLLARAAISGAVGVCVTGLAAALFGAAGLPFRLWQVLVVAIVGLGISLLLRRAVPRLEPRPDRRAWLLIGLWILSVLAAGVVAFWRIPDPDRISQTYDNVFHLSATSAVLDGFSASAFTLRSLVETTADGIAYYPSAWHALAALTVQTGGVTVPVAFNAAWIAIVAVLWLPGIAWLVRLLVPGWTAAIVAVPLGVCFGWFPYALLTWGTDYPSVIAHALLPTAVAMTVLVTRAVLRNDDAESTDAQVVLLASIGLAVVLGSLAFADPRALLSWLVLTGPYVVWRSAVVSLSVRRLDEGGRVLAALWGGGGAFVVIAAVVITIAGAGTLGEPADPGSASSAVQSPWEGVQQVVMLRAMTGVNGIVTLIAPLLALSVIAGVVVALRRSTTRWIVVSYAMTAALYIVAVGSDGAASRIVTGFWHGDGVLIAAALPVLAIPLATIGVVTLARLIAPVRRGVAAASAVLAGVVIAITSTGTLAPSGFTESAGTVFHQPADGADQELVSSRQIAFMENEVRQTVPEGQRILGDPWDGSALTWLFADREPVFPHLAGQWDRQRQTLAWGLAGIEDDPKVCEALDDLRVRYVLYDPHRLGGGDSAGGDVPGPHAAVESELFTRVASSGSTVLYRIDQCGELP